MKKTTLQSSRVLLLAAIASLAGAGFATAASAVDVNTEASPKAGATAGAHMSPSGSANSNAQWQTDANKGAERAGARMSDKGAEHKPDSAAPPEAAAATSKGKDRR